MFWVLFWKEVRDHLMTFRFGAALITIFILAVVSVWILGGDYQRRRDAYNTLSERAAQDAREVRVPSRIIPIIYRSPSKLGIFAQGEEKRLGNAVEIRRYSVPVEAVDRLTDNELMAAFIPFDLLTVFTLIISLFGILISYDAISGDKEKGVLKLICTYRLSRGKIFTAKFLSGIVVLIFPLLIGFICSLLVLQFVYQISFDGAQWLAISLMFLAVFLYGSLFIAIGLFCSSLFRRSSTSLVLSLLIWTVMVLLIPGAAVKASNLIVETPSPLEVRLLKADSLRELIARRDEFRSNNPRPAGLQHGTAVGYDDSPRVFECCTLAILDLDLSENRISPELWDWSIDIFRLTEALWQERAETVYNLERLHLDKKEQQKQLADFLSSPSPTFHLRTVFTACADTDYTAQRRFLECTRRYRRELLSGFRDRGYFTENAVSFFSQLTNEDLTPERIDERWSYYISQIHEPSDIFEVLNAENWDPLPSDLIPHFDNISAAPRFEDSIQPIGILLFMVALAFVAGFVTFIRYDVR